MVEARAGRIKDRRRVGVLALLDCCELLAALADLWMALTDGWNGRR
jgi:hypothetical protein